MLQKKTLRIFEQLMIFCLLQLVVAAVFNHALSYGLLLIPICLLAATALGLLSSLSVNESMAIEGIKPLIRRPASALSDQVFVSGDESFEYASRWANRLPRTILLSIVPAVALVGAIFFYALPRTTDSARPDGNGQALVGFSDHLNLQRIGRMQQSGQLAMRVRLRDQDDKSRPYMLRKGMYLRGKVLDSYIFQKRRRTTTYSVWTSSPAGNISSNMPLPVEFVPKDDHDASRFDRVEVDIGCESFRTSTLFTISPYYSLSSDKRVIHDLTRSTLRRRYGGDRVYPRFRYNFLTHGFHKGVQSRYIAQPSAFENPMAPAARDEAENVDEDGYSPSAGPARDFAQDAAVDPNASSLSFNPERLPTAKLVADRLVSSMGQANRNPFRIAERLEDHLSSNKEYTYTLRLDRPKIDRMDPIEQFLSVDKAGHCQFFASALAMMLRSQGIPARIVVGYRTEEYNELGEYYIVRQLHAHAWVEALINKEHIGSKDALYRQSTADNYWVRFDPTPSYSLSAAENAGGVSQVFDLAQNIWDDYVVDMDGQRQTNALASGSGSGAMFASYGQFFSWLEIRINDIRAGQLGGGTLAGRPAFSWIAAMLTVAIGVVLFSLSRIPLRRRTHRESVQTSDRDYQEPRYQFYRETLAELARLGISRDPNQTPMELALSAHENSDYPERIAIAHALDSLTTMYNRNRYGSRDVQAAGKSDQVRKPLPLPEAEKSEADDALTRLRQRIDELTAENPPSE